MANKITCTCGHSWNKSDSSKKDAYVCHVCGKNIKNMQLGGNIYPASYVPQAEEGWLERYADGGSMQEHQENYNDSSVSMGPGFVGMGNNTKGRNYSPAWGGQFEDGGDIPQAQDGTLEKIYSKWPALKKLGNVTIKPDESFTKEKTKAGDIEFFSPDTPQVTYSSGYVAPHPGPGTYGILYNPINNNEQNIRLDMLHGMPEADSHFRRLRNSFERSVKHSDIHKSMNHWYDKDKESGNAEDGRKRWMDNYVDGQIRTLLYEGDRSKQNYSDEEANELLAHPKIKKKFDKLNSYLQKGQFGTSLPGATGHMYARYNEGGAMPGGFDFNYPRTGEIPSNGPYAKKTKASAQNGAEMSFYQNGLDWTPKNISRDGAWLDKYDVPQAQSGLTFDDLKSMSRQRAPSDATRVVAPQKDKRTKAEALDQRARANQPIIQTPKGKQLTREQILAKNKQYAEEQGKVFNPETGSVSNFLSPSTARTFERASENIVEPMIDIEMAMSAAPMVGQGLKAAGKYLTEETALKNAYKLNPWAFKPNPEAVYRQMGEPGYQNAIQEGRVLAKGQKEFLEENPGFNYWDEYNKFMDYSNKTGLNLEKPKVAPFFQKGELFFPISNKTGFGRGKTAASDVKYLLEGKLPQEAVVPRYRDQYLTKEVFDRNVTGGTGVLDPKYSDLSNFDMYQKHWLQGYKKIPKPTSSFKSEIDWDKWNPETSKYPELINEYNTIEESTKKADIWMKNPDGSTFKGTPEQFIQQQSSYFKKAFGDSKLVNPDGSPAFQYHGGKKGYEQFLTPQDKGYIKRDSYTGDQGIYFTPSKSRGKSYAKNTPKDDRELYQTYVNMENPYTGKIKGTFRKDQITNEQYEELLRNEYDGIIDKNLFPYHRQTIVFDPKRIKSAVGNVGFFDMTNPNIYKGLVPTVLGGTAAAAIQQKKQGGSVIKDDRGQWAHPGEITEIQGDTMATHGYGDIPLWVEPDVGEPRLVQPNTGTHKFPGAKKFKETPVSKKWLEKYK